MKKVIHILYLINDPWIIGVGGGILSGILVTFVSRKFFFKKDEKEYIQKTAFANREVIHAIRPGIAESIMPDANIVEALIQSTARKHGISASDMHSKEEIAQELTKEIMDSSFISSEQKKDYCKHLIPLRSFVDDAEEESLELRSINYTSPRREYRSQSATLMSFVFGISAVIISTFTILLSLLDYSAAVYDTYFLVIFMAMALYAVMIALLLQIRSRRLGKKVEQVSESQKDTCEICFSRSLPKKE